MPFELIDKGGDAAIRATGTALPDAMEAAVMATYALIADPSSVRPLVERELSVRGNDIGSLVVSLLNEVLFLFDTQGFLGASARVSLLSGNTARCMIAGEAMDRARHEIHSAPKAATYHRLLVAEGERGAAIEVVFDL